jgi:anti-sigma28 factor (negative regulator of flagellin synthesis)
MLEGDIRLYSLFFLKNDGRSKEPMKITDQGFTERLSSQANRLNSASDAEQGAAASSTQPSGCSDLLQLSSIASRLQTAEADESAGGRASRVSQLARVVNSGSFRINASQISSALISESVQVSR